MGKVKVSKEVFDALESTKPFVYYGLNYQKTMVDKFLEESFSGDSKVLNEMQPHCFFECIYLGYELEMTKEEKAKSYFNDLDDDEKDIAKTILYILGVECEGITK